jgi:hypothetical protein
VQFLACEQTETALNVIIGIMNSDSVLPADRLKAAGMILDRGWGKPNKTLVTEGAEGPGLRRIVREIVHVTETREQIDNEGVVVDYHEIKTVNGNTKAPGAAADLDTASRQRTGHAA